MTRTEAHALRAELAAFVGECPTHDPAALRRIGAISGSFRDDRACGAEVRRLAQEMTTWLSVWCGPGDWSGHKQESVRVSLNGLLATLSIAIDAECAEA
jgi:hypothetical protein